MKRLAPWWLCWAVLALTGCVTERSVSLPPSLPVPPPERLYTSSHLESPYLRLGPEASLEVMIDVLGVEKAAPYIRQWADHASAVSRAWYPVISAQLASDGFVPPKRLTFVFLPHHHFPAQYHERTIYVSTDDLCRDLSNYGMMIHEITHAVQGYPAQTAVAWLVEGIADYVRFYLYEADPTSGGIVPGRSKYTDSYRSTACFLDYLVRNYDPAIIRKFNARLRQGLVTEEEIKRMIADDPEVAPERRRTLEALYRTFVADWSQAHLETGKAPAGP